MGLLLTESIVKSGIIEARDITGTYRKRRKSLATLKKLGVNATRNNLEALSQASNVLICVKPKDMDALLFEIGGYLSGKTVISITAGISATYIEGKAKFASVVTAMPTVGAIAGISHTALSVGHHTYEFSYHDAVQLFSAMGTVEHISGSQRTAFTVDAACTPAIAANIIHHLAKEVSKFGFSYDESVLHVAHGFDAAVALVLKKGMAPKKIVKLVACEGGLTAEGIKKAEQLGLGSILAEIVRGMISQGIKLQK